LSQVFDFGAQAAARKAVPCACWYLTAVPMPLPAAPLAVRRAYLAVVPRPVPRPLPAATRLGPGVFFAKCFAENDIFFWQREMQRKMALFWGSQPFCSQHYLFLRKKNGIYAKFSQNFQEIIILTSKIRKMVLINNLK
jgi:hypothetical protein